MSIIRMARFSEKRIAKNLSNNELCLKKKNILLLHYGIYKPNGKHDCIKSLLKTKTKCIHTLILIRVNNCILLSVIQIAIWKWFSLIIIINFIK